MKTRQRLIAVLLLVSGPVWFSLASGPGVPPTDQPPAQEAKEQPPAPKKQPPSLAEIVE